MLNKAFLEANKDLQKLLERGTAAAANPAAPAQSKKVSFVQPEAKH